jgi:hypothetical protein
MTIKANSIEFIFGSGRLLIPWKEVTSISKEDKMFKEFLIVETPKGKFRFKDFENLDGAVASLKDAQ